MTEERSVSVPAGYEIRPFEPGDEPAVVELLCSRFEGWRRQPDPKRLFRWKHDDNPFGASLRSVVVHGGEVVAFRAFLRWECAGGGRGIRILRGADAATHPDHVRRGLWQAMTLTDLDRLDGDADLGLAHGNPSTRAGYAKLGWQEVGALLPLVTPASLSAAASIRRKPELLAADAPAVLDVLAADPVRLTVRGGEAERVATPVSASLLRWRYLEVPDPAYGAVVTELSHGQVAVTFGWIRERRGLREFRVSSIVTSDRGDPSSTGSAARRVMADLRRLPVHYVVQLTGGGARPVRSRARLDVPWPPGRICVVTQPLRPGAPRPRWGRWDLTLGDLEPSLF